MDYYDNIKNNLKLISELNVEPKDLEKKAFSVRGRLLNNYSQIHQEMCKLYGVFAHDIDIEDNEIREYYSTFLDKMDKLVDTLDYTDKLQVECLKKIIVYFQMRLGMKLSFYTTFTNMVLKDEFSKLNDDDYSIDCINLFKYLKGDDLELIKGGGRKR